MKFVGDELFEFQVPLVSFETEQSAWIAGQSVPAKVRSVRIDMDRLQQELSGWAQSNQVRTLQACKVLIDEALAAERLALVETIRELAPEQVEAVIQAIAARASLERIGEAK